jgi:hypothetical protein
MNEFKQCPNGHYYKGSHCPFCSGQERITKGTIFSPIANHAVELNEKANVVLKFDTAPDGLNRYIEIKRKRFEHDLKSRISSVLDCTQDDIPPAIERKALEIDNMISQELLKKNIFHFKNPQNNLLGNYYLSDKTVNAIVPPTLMTQILGSISKLDHLYADNGYRYANSEVALNTAACASYGDENFRKARKEVESKKHVAISLRDDSIQVVCIPDWKNPFEVISVERFQSEDVSVFQPRVWVRSWGERKWVTYTHTDEYTKMMSQIANDNSLSVNYKVARQQVAKTLSSLFNELSLLHKSGYVHCDLKPQNILCYNGGLHPIDPIKVRIGEVAAGMTTNFCAPEQILAQPVTPATDIYNLGLIVLSIVDGVVFGKISDYVLPTGGTKTKTIKQLVEPYVYIDDNESNIENKEGIPYWRAFLEKSLSFNPADRFPDIDCFAMDYHRLLAQYPLKNDIEFRPDFGNLSFIKQRDNGNLEPAWFIE